MKLHALTLALLASLSNPVQALGNVFTYQGSLSDATVAATGTYDLQFTLQTTGGTNIGSPLIKDDVLVSAGVFSVELDFGPAIAGGDYQLQIGVRPGASSGAFTALSPATKILPTPQATFASAAQISATVSNGAIGSAQINSTEVQARVTSSCPSGQAIRVVNANGSVTCETAMTGPQGIQGIQGPPGPTGATGATGAQGPAGSVDAWSRLGNAGTDSATNFLGTTDARSLVFRTRNVQSLRIDPSTDLFGGIPITANIIAGSSANSASPTVRGATIAGGGVPVGNSDPTYPLDGPNRVTNHFGTVGGGFNNQAGDGTGNPLNSAFGTVAGGHSNLASGAYSTVSGGSENIARGLFSTVIGGRNNEAMGWYSAVSGGSGNCAGAIESWAGGNRAKVRPGGTAPSSGPCIGLTTGQPAGDDGTFVWADSQSADFVSTGPNQFSIRAAGGLRWGGTGVNSTTSPAFTHQVQSGVNLCDGGSGANTRTYLNHPLLNGNPAAVIVMTPNFGPQSSGTAPPRNPMAVYYSDLGTAGCPAGRWVIYQTSLTAEVINPNARFNIWFVLP